MSKKALFNSITIGEGNYEQAQVQQRKPGIDSRKDEISREKIIKCRQQKKRDMR